MALITTLLLRGAQTPGELRSRAARMYRWAVAVVALEQLANREDGPFVVGLAREPGKRENRYMHLFSGEVEDRPGGDARICRTRLSGMIQARVKTLGDGSGGSWRTAS